MSNTRLNDGMLFRDTTNAPRPVGNFWGTRFKTTADANRSSAPRPSLSTPRATRPSTAVPSHADSPQSGGRVHETPNTGAAVRPRLSMSPGLKFDPSPQRPLFQRYLLRELEAHEAKPHLTVVLDLDETLVSNRRADLTEAILRPYALQALSAIRQLPGVEIVLWTASTQETGGPVVEQLQEKRRIFDEVIFRNDLWFTEPVHTKDLRLLGRDMDKVVVFDNAPNCCKLNRDNAVLVDDFTGLIDKRDATLINVFNVIQSLVNATQEGHKVGDHLSRMFGADANVKMVHYALPAAWENVNLRDISPLMVPPHGKFYKAASHR